MDFEWNRDKAASNLKKHRIDFADAATVFDDLNAITIDIRIISARKATKQEQKYYGSKL